MKPEKTKIPASKFSHIPESMRNTAIAAFTDPRIPNDARRVIEQYVDKVEFKYNEYRGTFYRPGNNFINISMSTLKEERIHKTLKHEFGHALDYKAERGNFIAFSASENFIKETKIANRSVGQYTKTLAHREKIYKYVKEYKNDPSLSDFFCSLTKGDILGDMDILYHIIKITLGVLLRCLPICLISTVDRNTGTF